MEKRTQKISIASAHVSFRLDTEIPKNVNLSNNNIFTDWKLLKIYFSFISLIRLMLV